MAFQIANPLGTGSDQEILDLIRAAIVKVTVAGQSYAIGGRTFTRASLRELQELETIYQQRVAAASTSQRNETLAHFHRR